MNNFAERTEREASDVPFSSEYFPALVPPKYSGVFGPGNQPLNHPSFEERDHYLATVYGFDKGGFEASVRWVDAQKMIDAAMRPRGSRKPVEERSETDMLRSVARAKKTLRHAVKQIAADHLLTLTTREEKNSPESLARMWKAFARNYRHVTGELFLYVAIPERHPTNPDHWHLHVAITGRLKLHQARQIWWACCGGRGQGNVDVKEIRVGCDQWGFPKGPLVRSEKIARYISKYMTKDLIFAHRPDKKRYWRSEFDLPKARQLWLKTRPEPTDPNVDGTNSLTEAFGELRERMGGFDPTRCSFFFFPDGTGFWFSYNPDARCTVGFAEPPPF